MYVFDVFVFGVVCKYCVMLFFVYCVCEVVVRIVIRLYCVLCIYMLCVGVYML